VLIQVGERVGRIQRPNLLAAILAKVEALNLPGSPQRHLQDLGFLLALMPDPIAARSTLTTKERTRLGSCPLLNRGHREWKSLPDADANAGHAALRLLAVRS
jgi:hypothetical protein